MIELAPNHKIGLPVSSPVMIASGFCGYGDAYQRLVDLVVFGAVVTQPITLRPHRGKPQPRLAEISGGFILNTGQNPGVKRVIKQYSKKWARLGAPVMAHLPAAEPDDLMRTARALAGHHIAAFELGLPPDTLPEEISDWVGAIYAGSELPIFIKLPLHRCLDLAEAAIETGIDGLVIGAPPPGTGGQEIPVTGSVYGPFLHSFTRYAVQELHNIKIPIIAVGGVHTLQEVDVLLEAGAAAVQIDSLMFTDPGQAEAIGRARSLMTDNSTA